MRQGRNRDKEVMPAGRRPDARVGRRVGAFRKLYRDGMLGALGMEPMLQGLFEGMALEPAQDEAGPADERVTS